MHSDLSSSALLTPEEVVSLKPGGALVLDAEGRILAANSEAVRLFADESQNLTERTIDEIIWEGQASEESCTTKLITRAKQLRSFIAALNLVARRSDGSEFPVGLHLTPLERTEGHYLAAVKDLTESPASEEMFRSLIDELADPLLVLEGDELVFWNRAALALFGTPSSAEIAGSSTDVHDLIVPAQREEMIDIHRRRLRGEDVPESYEIECQHRDRRLTLNVRPRLIQHAGRTLTLVVIRDVTKRKELEQMLVEYRSILDESLRAGGVATWSVDLAKQSIEMSLEARRLIGLEGASSTREMFAAVHLDDHELVSRAVEAAIRGDQSFDVDFRFLRPDGEVLFLHSMAEVQRDDSGAPLRLVGTTRDVTKRREREHRLQELEKQLHQAQRMEAVGMLAGGVAHDFNNLLTTVIGYSELTLRELGDDHPLSENLRQIRRAGQRAGRLTHQLLAFSRQQVLEPLVMNLNDVVKESEQQLRHTLGEDIDLDIALAPDLEAVEADPVQLSHVLINLAINAQDAMPDGGKLRIETSNAALEESAGEGKFRVKGGAYVKLVVSDTGCGMDQHHQDRAFEPFFSTKSRALGTGLGLSTVYGIIKQSNGYIWLSSAEGEGTELQIYLPAVDADAVEASSVDKANGVAGRQRRILVVEDDDSVRLLATFCLREAGYEVLEAKDGEIGLTLCDQPPGSLDLLLTDIVLPGAASGHDVAAYARTLHPEIEVLFTSGYPGFAAESSADLSDFLAKPFTPSRLVKRIREMLREDSSSTGGNGRRK